LLNLLKYQKEDLLKDGIKFTLKNTQVPFQLAVAMKMMEFILFNEH
jgi:hypothetical protein